MLQNYQLNMNLVLITRLFNRKFKYLGIEISGNEGIDRWRQKPGNKGYKNCKVIW